MAMLRVIPAPLDGACVSATNRHATCDYLAIVDGKMPANDCVILSQGNLRAGIETSRLRGKHERLSEKSAVEPATYLKVDQRREMSTSSSHSGDLHHGTRFVP